MIFRVFKVTLIFIFISACRPAISENPAVEFSTSEPAQTATAIKSRLFDINWDDRSHYRQGLVSAAQYMLDDLEGASVYHIDLTIGNDYQSLQGTQEVLYTNTEPVPLDRIVFRLFPNLLGGRITINSTLLNGILVSPELSMENTVLNIHLPEPLETGEQVLVSMQFEVIVPTGKERNYGILAYSDEVLALAHFYPFIAVYDDEGWNVEIPPEIGDIFFGDASFYTVRVTAPEELILAASGRSIRVERKNEVQTIVYAAGPARDFYLAGSPTYAKKTISEGEIVINSYAPADYQDSSNFVLDSAAAAFEIFNSTYGLYPYNEFDIITSPTLAGGIEYPGITAIAIRLYSTDFQKMDVNSRVTLEAIVVHEIAHQWFYNLVGNDQLDEPWLDEAMAQFATLEYFRNTNLSFERGFFQSLEQRWNRVNQASIPVGLPVREYSGRQYGAIVYGRGPLFIDELSNEMGPEVFNSFLKNYTSTYSWRISTTEGFQSLAEEHCNCDLSPLFNTWVHP